MNQQQKDHIKFITAQFTTLAFNKYKKGAEEHGGGLWDVEDLIYMAMEECIDQFIYLSTLKDQIEISGVKLGKRKDLKK